MASEGTYNYLFKFIIIGDTFVGKSNILSRYANNRFNSEHEITIGCEFMTKNLQIQDRTIRVQIWDTAGQEAFRSITRSYYKNSACAVIVYDITNKISFDNVKGWLSECKEMCSRDLMVVLVGNKSDLEDQRVVSEAEGKKIAEENNMYFYETSALNGSKIEEMFSRVTQDLVTLVESGTIKWDANSSGIQIGWFPNKDVEHLLDKDKKGCCG